MKGKYRGITLVEIVVASFVMSILLLVAVQVMMPALRAWSDGQKRSEVSQSLLVTSNWLGDDVLRSSPNSLDVNDEGTLVMKCAASIPTDENNEFSETVAYWVEEKELFRGVLAGTGVSGTPPVITLAELGNLQTKRRVASGVEIFEVTVVQPWRIEFRLELERDGRRGELQTSYSSVYAPFDRNVAEQNNESES